MTSTGKSWVLLRRLTRDQMLRERADLLSGIDLTEDELRAAGAAWELDSHHRGVLSRVNGLDFLLSHTPDPNADSR